MREGVMFGWDSWIGFSIKMALFAYAMWKLINWIWWLQDRYAEFMAERKAKREAKHVAHTGHAGEPVVQGKLPKGTFQ
jgi:hypothetical protein